MWARQLRHARWQRRERAAQPPRSRSRTRRRGVSLMRAITIIIRNPILKQHGAGDTVMVSVCMVRGSLQVACGIRSVGFAMVYVWPVMSGNWAPTNMGKVLEQGQVTEQGDTWCSLHRLGMGLNSKCFGCMSVLFA